MVLYKVKLYILKDHAKDWFKWMSDIHIPEVINTGHFIDYTFMREFDSDEIDPEVEVYEIQYVCKNQHELEEYKRNDAEAIRKKHTDLYGAYVKKVHRSESVDVTEPELEEIVCLA